MLRHNFFTDWMMWWMMPWWELYAWRVERRRKIDWTIQKESNGEFVFTSKSKRWILNDNEYTKPTWTRSRAHSQLVFVMRNRRCCGNEFKSKTNQMLYIARIFTKWIRRRTVLMIMITFRWTRNSNNTAQLRRSMGVIGFHKAKGLTFHQRFDIYL